MLSHRLLWTRESTAHVGYYKMDILMGMGFRAQEETVGVGGLNGRC